MYRRRSDFPIAILLAVLLAASVSGCATTAGGARQPATKNSDKVVSQTQVVPIRPALVEVEADVGFTVTEVVTITGSDRANYREALRLLAQDEFAAGIALLVQVVASAPDATAPFVDLGIAYGRTGDLVAAESSFKQALASTPDHPVAHNELGIVYRKQGRFLEARQSYQRALAVYPGFHYARRNLAVLCDLYLADMACALEQYELYRQTVADDHEVEIWVGDIRNRVAPAQ